MLRPERDKPNPYFSYKAREESGAALAIAGGPYSQAATLPQATVAKLRAKRHHVFFFTGKVK